MDIFVSNLPFEITEQEITEAFASFGAVSGVKMLFDKVSGRFRGIAFVTMEQDADGDTAIAELNGKELGGRPMRVDRSRPREERFNGFGGGFDRNKRQGNGGGGFRGRSTDSREGSGQRPEGFAPRKSFGGGFRGKSNFGERQSFGENTERPYRQNGGFKKRFDGGNFRNNEGDGRQKKFWGKRDFDE